MIVKGSLTIHAPRVDSEQLGPALCSFGIAQTLGENMLLASTDSAIRHATDSASSCSPLTRRSVTAVAQGDCVLMRLSQPVFRWFIDSHPDALTSFVLTTTSRQWRVAYYLLVEFLRLQDSWLASLEPPGAHPAFDLSDLPSVHPNVQPLASNVPAHDATAAAPSQSLPAVPITLAALRSSSSAVLLKQPGDIVFREGADADFLYVILSGHAACHVAGGC